MTKIMSLENKALMKADYSIERKIGGGGSGLTYLVKDDSGKKYCMKEFRFGMKKGDENTFKARELFEREAEILQSLNHPQIPKYEDYFVDDSTGEEKLYLVMENIPGKSLDKTKLTEQEAIHIAKEMTEILDYLHNHSPPIVHRDIKPQNIIKTPDNKIKLVDFGSVADKVLRDSKISYTRVGTFGYSAPESLYGESRPASDIYSLGATLISLLSGTDPTKMMNSRNRIDFKGKLNVSKQTEKLLWDMTDPDWEKRIGSAKELEARLNGRKFGKKFFSLEKRIEENNELIIPKEKISFVPDYLKEAGKSVFNNSKEFIIGFFYVNSAPYIFSTSFRRIKDDNLIKDEYMDARAMGFITGLVGLISQFIPYMKEFSKNGAENLPLILGTIATTNALSYGYETIKYNLEKRKEARLVLQEKPNKTPDDRKFHRTLRILEEAQLTLQEKINKPASETKKSLLGKSVDKEIKLMKKILQE
jgi:serine/threonine protein kinase